MKNSVLFVLTLLATIQAKAYQLPENELITPKNLPFTATLIIDELHNPWGMAFLPDKTILVTEKSGKLIHWKSGSKTFITNLPKVYNRGQGGLMDIAVHPDYTTNGWIYFTYASTEGKAKGGHTALMRARIANNALIDKELLYKAAPNTTKGQHFGSRIAFDDQGHLYFTIGERGARDENPQSLQRDGGKVYRLNDDGSIPDDNPFVDNTTAKSAIYSYGHRNPQGLVKHPRTGKLWSHEHGPRGGDEINILKAGANYGWPLVTYGINYDRTAITPYTEKKGLEPPLHYWVPSIAPSGMAFVSTDTYAAYGGSLLVGSLAFQYLERLVIENRQVVRREKLLDGLGRVRNVKEGPDGYLYVGVEGKGIYKLIPKK